MSEKPNLSKSPINVLIVEDDAVTARVIQELLAAENCSSYSATSLSEALSVLSKHSVDLVLLDLYLGSEDGFALLPILSADFPYAKAIVVTAHGSIDLAIKAVQAGATGFITKPVSREKIKEALEPVKQAKLNSQEPVPGPWEGIGMIGTSLAVRNLQSNIMRMKDVDSTVLITGESGTGKELVARALHKFSPRSQDRFEAINCGAIPENLIESELFGHRKGAFTDAKSDRKGLFEVCRDGVVFLDEVGELPLMMQVKLLRVLQEREITPIGATTPIKVNPRVIAATNRDLALEVKKGRFREDLYFRLAVLCINVPNLAHRAEDIPHLVQFFLKRFNERFQKSIKAPNRENMNKLQNHYWPGNIRELQNAVERGVVLCQSGELHFEDMVSTEVSSSNIAEINEASQPPRSGTFSPLESFEDKSPSTNAVKSEYLIDYIELAPLTKAREQFETAYLKKLLTASRGNVSEAARISGRYRADLYRLFSKYEIDPNNFKSQQTLPLR